MYSLPPTRPSGSFAHSINGVAPPRSQSWRWNPLYWLCLQWYICPFLREMLSMKVIKLGAPSNLIQMNKNPGNRTHTLVIISLTYLLSHINIIIKATNIKLISLSFIDVKCCSLTNLWSRKKYTLGHLSISWINNKINKRNFPFIQILSVLHRPTLRQNEVCSLQAT